MLIDFKIITKTIRQYLVKENFNQFIRKMFNRLKNRVLTAVSPDLPAISSNNQHSTGTTAGNHHTNHSHSNNNRNLPDKFTYSRPPFLQLLTSDELKASADHNVRPIIVPRDISVMPLNTGYAECVNSGKSEWNEDQAAFHRHILSHPSKEHPDLPYIYFGIFDGHAGYGAALAAAHQFHYILHEKLVDVIDLLLPRTPMTTSIDHHPLLFHRTVSKDDVIIGALESAFVEMDTLLAEDRDKYRNAGGCTALVTLFIFGKMFVSNAGDSRAVLCQRLTIDSVKTNPTGSTSVHHSDINNHIFNKDTKNSHTVNNIIADFTDDDDDDDNDDDDDDDDDDNNNNNNNNNNKTNTNRNNKNNLYDRNNFRIFPVQFSYDHTPDTERPRLMSTAKLNPSLMAGEYVAMEYAKRPMVKDLGTRILYRQGQMKGWAYKTLTRDDLKMTIVAGEGKRSRLMGTIGVTRGFGDHDLRALVSGLPIKPFLSPHPDVVYRDLTNIISIPSENNVDGEYGVLIMATDGLWDVADTGLVSRIVFETLNKYPNEKHRYTMVAQELVAKARGRVNDAGHWRLTETKAAATVDDISVLVIPVYQYYQEYVAWERFNFDNNINNNNNNNNNFDEDINKISKIDNSKQISVKELLTNKNDKSNDNNNLGEIDNKSLETRMVKRLEIEDDGSMYDENDIEEAILSDELMNANLDIPKVTEESPIEARGVTIGSDSTITTS